MVLPSGMLKIAFTSRSRCLTPRELQALETGSSQLPVGMDTVPMTEQMKASQCSMESSRVWKIKYHSKVMRTALCILVPKILAYRVGKLNVRYLQTWFTVLSLEGQNFRSHFALHFFLKLLGVPLSMKNL